MSWLLVDEGWMEYNIDEREKNTYTHTSTEYVLFFLSSLSSIFLPLTLIGATAAIIVALLFIFVCTISHHQSSRVPLSYSSHIITKSKHPRVRPRWWVCVCMCPVPFVRGWSSSLFVLSLTYERKQSRGRLSSSSLSSLFMVRSNVSFFFVFQI